MIIKNKILKYLIEKIKSSIFNISKYIKKDDFNYNENIIFESSIVCTAIGNINKNDLVIIWNKNVTRTRMQL